MHLYWNHVVDWEKIVEWDVFPTKHRYFGLHIMRVFIGVVIVIVDKNAPPT